MASPPRNHRNPTRIEIRSRPGRRCLWPVRAHPDRMEYAGGPSRRANRLTARPEQRVRRSASRTRRLGSGHEEGPIPLIPRSDDVLPANHYPGKVFVTRFSTMSGRPFDRCGARACPARPPRRRDGRRIRRERRPRPSYPARRFRANRADSSIRKPLSRARRRVGRSPTAKR